MNTAKRVVQKEEKKQAKILGKLSIIVGANKQGDIVVREGDNIERLARNFMTIYSLKREILPTIVQSLEQLVVKTKYSRESVSEEQLNIQDGEQTESVNAVEQ